MGKWFGVQGSGCLWNLHSWTLEALPGWPPLFTLETLDASTWQGLSGYRRAGDKCSTWGAGHLSAGLQAWGTLPGGLFAYFSLLAF